MRERQPISLLLFDVDDFKKNNDLYGHIARDDARRKVAASIGACATRPSDTVAPFGGGRNTVATAAGSPSEVPLRTRSEELSA